MYACYLLTFLVTYCYCSTYLLFPHVKINNKSLFVGLIKILISICIKYLLSIYSIRVCYVCIEYLIHTYEYTHFHTYIVYCLPDNTVIVVNSWQGFAVIACASESIYIKKNLCFLAGIYVYIFVTLKSFLFWSFMMYIILVKFYYFVSRRKWFLVWTK